ERIEIPRQGLSYRFNAKLDIADLAGQLDFHRNFFSGHTALLIHSNAALVDIKRQALEALGFTVVTETQYERAINILLSNASLEKPIETVVYYFEGEGEEALAFNKELQERKELGFIKQIIAVSPTQKVQLAKVLFNKTQPVFLVNKPVGLFELESTFHLAYAETNNKGSGIEFTKYPDPCRLHIISDSHKNISGLSKVFKHHQLKLVSFNNEKAL